MLAAKTMTITFTVYSPEVSIPIPEYCLHMAVWKLIPCFWQAHGATGPQVLFKSPKVISISSVTSPRYCPGPKFLSKTFQILCKNDPKLPSWAFLFCAPHVLSVPLPRSICISEKTQWGFQLIVGLSRTYCNSTMLAEKPQHGFST